LPPFQLTPSHIEEA
jgi:hypothetical protein